MLRLKRERVRLDRDVILALTADEETGEDNGVQWLLDKRPELIEAAFAINGDAGDPIMRDGKVYERNVEASEKVYMDVRLEVHNPGGHSSIPVKENAIYRLAAALERFSQYEFPPRLNEVTRAYFSRAAASETDTIAARMRMVGETGDTTAMRRLSEGSPWLSSVLRTTCVATRLDGGHANNALPQTAGANINCRILPDERPDDGGGYHPSSRGRHQRADHGHLAGQALTTVTPGSGGARADRQHHGVHVARRCGDTRAWTPGHRTASTFGTPACRCTACLACRWTMTTSGGTGRTSGSGSARSIRGWSSPARLVRALRGRQGDRAIGRTGDRGVHPERSEGDMS